MHKFTFILSLHNTYGECLTGGMVALHRLAYNLAVRNHEVIIFTDPQYPHDNIISKKDSSIYDLNFDYNPENTVIVVPFVEWKNNSKTKNIVRWLLNDFDGDTSFIESDDIILNYGNFKINSKNYYNKLTTFDYHFDLFKNQNNQRNKKYCYILNKNTPSNWSEILNYYSAESLDDWKTKGNFKYLSEKFNEYEYFLTFDNKSFYTVAAAMCGCKSIILNSSSSISPIQYRQENPIQLCGVAFGVEDLDWCENTVDLTYDYILDLEKEDQKTIDQMINLFIK